MGKEKINFILKGYDGQFLKFLYIIIIILNDKNNENKCLVNLLFLFSYNNGGIKIQIKIKDI